MVCPAKFLESTLEAKFFAEVPKRVELYGDNQGLFLPIAHRFWQPSECSIEPGIIAGVARLP